MSDALASRARLRRNARDSLSRIRCSSNAAFKGRVERRLAAREARDLLAREARHREARLERGRAEVREEDDVRQRETGRDGSAAPSRRRRGPRRRGASDASAATSAASSTMGPRAVLTRIAPSFIRRNSFSPNLPRVSSVSGAWIDRTSTFERNSSELLFTPSLSKATHVSSRTPRRAARRPGRCGPCRRSRACAPTSETPRSSCGFQPSHVPERASASPSRSRRATARISAQARSAVASVRTSGVFVTRIPRPRHAARSMWSTPTEWLATIRARGRPRGPRP